MIKEAGEAERLARAAEEEGRKLLYTTDMQLAPFVWRDDRTTAEQLRVLLARHIPEERMNDEGGRMNETGRKPVSSFVLPPSSVQKKPDLRGFEWYYDKQLLDGSSTVLRAGAAAIIDFALPDDGPLVTLDQEGGLKQWDRETASLDSGLPSPNVAPAENNMIGYLSPNGKRLASAAGTTVRVWDRATGVVSYRLESSGALHDLSFSPDGRYLVTHDGRRTQWLDAANGQAIAHFDQAMVDFDIRSPRLSLSADGSTVAVWAQGNARNRISIFHLDATARKVTPQAEGLGNGGSMVGAALSPDGKLIVVGGFFTGSLFVYETATRRRIATHSSAHASPVWAIAFSQDGLDLATADAEGMIKTWGDARAAHLGERVHRTLKGHAAAITKVAFSNTGNQLVSGSRDGTVRLWELEPSRSGPRRLQASSAAPVFFAGGRLIATAEGNRVTIWDAASGQRLRNLAEGDTILSLAISPDNRLLAVGRYAGTGPPPPNRPCSLSIWEMNTGRRLAEFFDQDSDYFFAYCLLETLAFSPDGKFLVAGLGSRRSHFTSGRPS